MGNEVVKKDILAQYVHDAVEMEAAIFTLDQFKVKYQQDKEQMIREKEQEVEKATNYYNVQNDKVREAKETLEIYKQKQPKQEEFKQEKKTYGYFERMGRDIKRCLLIVLLFFCHLILFNVIQALLSKNGIELSGKASTLLTWIELAIVLALFIIVYVLRKRKKAKRIKDEHTRKFEESLNNHKLHILSLEEECKAQSEEARARYMSVSEARAELQKTKKYCESIDKQISIITQQRNMIKKNLEQFYNYGLVPPDYRTFDCVIMLDQIFRNDLADTMREAIKIYEERVFRGSVIRGMDKICSMLGQLSSDMLAISLKLDMVNSNIAHMSSDFDSLKRRMVSESAKNRAVTEDLIRETQLGRYTNEKLLESTKALEKYANDRRLGII